MNNVKISYLVTCHNEDVTLNRLLRRLEDVLRNADDEVVILDDHSSNEKTKKLLTHYASIPNFKVCYDALDDGNGPNYGRHKNKGNELCSPSSSFIFQIDGDECPTETLLLNLKNIIDVNPTIELIYVPRINDYKGVGEVHARQWGWRLIPCPVYENRPIVNWPDFQGRVYKNNPSRIKWDRRLHEKIEGHKEYTFLPEDYDLALYHDKTIETQLETNKRYNVWFTQEENQGHKVI